MYMFDFVDKGSEGWHGLARARFGERLGKEFDDALAFRVAWVRSKPALKRLGHTYGDEEVGGFN